MLELDELRVRRPGRPVRLLGACVVLLGLVVLANSVLLILGGGPVAVFVGGCGIVGWAYSLKFDLLLLLLRWETRLDRQARTVTRRARLLRTIQQRQYAFSDFESVELRRLGGEQPGSPGVLAVLLVGPNVALDVDDPGPVPSAGLFQWLARAVASYDFSGQLALANSLAEFIGVPLKDTTGRRERPADAPTRPRFGAGVPDSGEAMVVIPRVPRGLRIAALVFVVAGTSAVVLIARITPLNGGLETARTLVGLLALAVLPVAGALVLTYRSSVVIDIPSRIVRHRGSFLGSGWDDWYALDEFESVVVLEMKIPTQRALYRSVSLSGSRCELRLYDDRTVPRTLGTRAAGRNREERCLASAESLASLSGLPMRVVRLDPLPTKAGGNPAAADPARPSGDDG